MDNHILYHDTGGNRGAAVEYFVGSTVAGKVWHT